MNATAMILAGGMSTRLFPLTKDVPKPLVPLAGEPISAHVMRWLAAHGYRDVAMNVHYHADLIRAAFGDGSQFGVRLDYLFEPKLMGSAGAVKALAHAFVDTFVVVGCDDLTDADLSALVAFHKERGALATIGLVEVEHVDQYGVVVTDKRGLIVGFQEKPAPGTERSHLVNTGIYVFEPEILTRIPANAFYDFGRDVFPALQAANEAFYGFRLEDAYWRDIGTLSEYRLATRDAIAGRICLHASRERGIPPGTQLGRDVRIDDNVEVGAGVTVGDRVRIDGPAVIGAGVRIADDAVLERAILWDHVTIGTRARVIDSIVGTGYAVPADAALIDVVVANGIAS